MIHDLLSILEFWQSHLVTYLCLIAEEIYNKVVGFFNLKSLAFKAQLVISHILSSLNLQMPFYVQNSSEAGFCFLLVWFGWIFF